MAQNLESKIVLNLRDQLRTFRFESRRAATRCFVGCFFTIFYFVFFQLNAIVFHNFMNLFFYQKVSTCKETVSHLKLKDPESKLPRRCRSWSPYSNSSVIHIFRPQFFTFFQCYSPQVMFCLFCSCWYFFYFSIAIFLFV